jgi:hypothetical protein
MIIISAVIDVEKDPSSLAINLEVVCSENIFNLNTLLEYHIEVFLGS